MMTEHEPATLETVRFGFPESWRAKSGCSSPLLTQGLVVSGSLTTRPQGWHPAERRKRPLAGLYT